MSYGVIAVLLLRLEARSGRWEGVAELASHMQMSLDQVRAELEHLCADALVRVDRHHASGEIVAAMIAPREGAAR